MSYPTTRAEMLEYGLYLKAQADAMVVPPEYPDGLGSWAVMERRDALLRTARHYIEEALSGEREA